MTEHARATLGRHAREGLLVDTNISVLYCLGQVRPELIATFKRSRQFTPDDFAVLVDVWTHVSGRVATTPGILTEVSNLLGQLAEPDRSRVMAVLAGISKLLTERYAASRKLADGPTFVRYGLTDTAIVEACQSGLLVLSDDFSLTQYLTANGLAAIDFNHLRELR